MASFAQRLATRIDLNDPQLVESKRTRKGGWAGKDRAVTVSIEGRPDSWIRCTSYGGPAHSGIQVSPDGSWRMLAWLRRVICG